MMADATRVAPRYAPTPLQVARQAPRGTIGAYAPNDRGGLMEKVRGLLGMSNLPQEPGLLGKLAEVVGLNDPASMVDGPARAAAVVGKVGKAAENARPLFVFHGGRGATKEEAIERYIRRNIAPFVDEAGNPISSFTGQELPAFVDDPNRIARLEHARKIFENQNPQVVRQPGGIFEIWEGGTARPAAVSRAIGWSDELPADAVVPKHNWRAADLMDAGTESSIAKAFGSPNARVYRAFIPVEEMPKPKLAGGRTTYDWTELQRGRGEPPPLKIRIAKNGKASIADGNHRAFFWNEAGEFTHYPAYVIDERVAKGAK
jgi:hypothetical protein